MPPLKNTPSTHAIKLALAMTALAIPSGRAATYYWDTNSTTTGSGAATGTWDSSVSALWSTDSTGASATSAVTTTTADDLFFSAGTTGTTGTVSVSGTQAANSITFDDNVALTLSGGTQINLGTTGSTTAGITVASGDNANNTISTPIALGVNSMATNNGTGTLLLSGVVSGGFRLTGAGTGTVSLTNINTFSGGFTLSGATVVIGRDSAGAVGAVTSGAFGTGTITLNGGSLLANSANNVGNQKNVFNAINVASGTTILGANSTSANLRLMGAITGNGTLTNPIIGTTATSAIFGGDLSGFTGTFSYQNTNSLTNFRFGNNTGTAAAPLTGQTVDAAQAAFVVNASGAITRNVALTDNIGGSTFKMGSLSGNGVIRGSFNNSAQTTNTYEIGALGTDTTFSGLLSDITAGHQADFNIVKTGVGSLTLSGTSFYTGTTTVRNGKLIAGAAAASAANGAFGNSSTAIVLGDATTIASGTAFNPQLLTGGAFTVARAVTVGASNGALGNAGTTFTLGGNTTSSSTFSGVATLNQNLSVGQVSGGTLNLTGNILSGSSGTQTVTFNNIGTVAQSTGVIGGGTGTIAVTQAGTGTTTLAGTESYTGATQVTAGNLLLTGAGAINSSSGIAVNASGSNASFVQASSVAVSPTVTLTKGTVDGTGTINTVNVANLAGNTITNGTTSSGAGTGTLTIGALTFAGGGTITVNEANATRGLALTTFNTPNTGTGAITVNATNSSAWSAAGGNGSGVYDLITFTSFNGVLADLTKGTISGLGGRQSATLGNSSTAITLAIAGDTPVWTGQGSQTWTTVATNSNTGPNAWALKTGHTGTNFWASDAIEFNDTYNLGGGSVAVTNNTVTITGGVAPVSTNFNNSSVNYSITSSDSTGITSGSVLKNGTGSVTINTANSYTGGTTINSGKIIIGGNGTLGSGAVSLAGGALDLNGNNLSAGAVAISSPAVSGDTIIGSGGNLTVTSLTATNSTGNAVVSANLAGSGAITMNGGGTLTLTGTNTHTGGTVVNTGILALAGANNASNGALLVRGGTLVLAPGGSVAASSTATLGDGSLNTSGTFQLGDSTGAVSTTLAGLATTGTGTANAVVGGHTTVSTLTINNGSAVNYGGLIGGTGTNQNNLALVKSGAGQLGLTGANTYNGGTTVNAGTLALGANAAAGTGVITMAGGTLTNASGLTNANGINVTSPSTLLIGSGLNWNLNGNITGAGNITYSPSGNAATLALGGDNSGYTGTFTNTASNAAFQFSSATAGSANAAWVLSNPTTTRTKFGLSGSGTVDFGSLSGSAVGIVNNTASSTVTMSIGALNTNTTFSGSIIANSGVPTAQIAVTKVGSGTLTLSGANTYTGNTTINAGTLQVDGSLGATAIILNGGTFKVGSAGSISSSTITINGGSFDASALVGGYTVGSGQTIKGTGTFTGKVTIGAGGTLAPGNSPGVVTFDNDLTLAGTTDMEFLGTVRGDPTIGYDGVNLTGTGSNTLTYGGTLSMSFNAPLAAGVYDLFQLGSVAQGGDFASVGASGTEVGSFSGLVINTGIGWTATLVDIQGVPTTWTLAFNNTTGDLTIAAIPEPSIYAALTGFGAVGFAAYRRRRNVKRAA